MALKRKITKAIFDKLSTDLKAEYVEKDGDFVLDLDDDEGALKRAKDREVLERREANQRAADAEKRAKEAEDKLSALDNNDARKRGDIDAIDKSWQDKLAAQSDESNKAIAAKDAFISTSLVDTVAKTMAAKISNAPELILPHIIARLRADLTGNTPTTTFHDVAGNPVTIDTLEKEFIDNKAFASIITASKASGGGASSEADKRKGGAPQSHTKSGDDVPLLATMSGADLAKRLAEIKADNAS